jgi:hypothetical protein
METVTIPKDEYYRLRATASKVNLIEEVIHQPELSEEAIKELAKARATSRKEYISDKEMEKEFP